MKRQIGLAALATGITVIAASALGFLRGQSAILVNLEERPFIAALHVTAAFVMYLFVFFYLDWLRKKKGE
jgi:divalent metal cation (Fe/Co/Zn/Cd) transporter